MASRAGQTERLKRERQQIAQTKRFQKRAAWALGGVGLLLGYGAWQQKEAARREPLVFTSLSARAINEEQYDRALRFALQAYPPLGSVMSCPPAPTS